MKGGLGIGLLLGVVIGAGALAIFNKTAAPKIPDKPWYQIF